MMRDISRIRFWLRLMPAYSWRRFLLLLRCSEELTAQNRDEQVQADQCHANQLIRLRRTAIHGLAAHQDFDVVIYLWATVIGQHPCNASGNGFQSCPIRLVRPKNPADVVQWRKTTACCTMLIRVADDALSKSGRLQDLALPQEYG